MFVADGDFGHLGHLGGREASEVLAVPEPSSQVPFAPPTVALSEVPGTLGSSSLVRSSWKLWVPLGSPPPLSGVSCLGTCAEEFLRL